MRYRTKLASPAQKFLDKADRSLLDRIVDRLRRLEAEPFPSDSKRVLGRREKVFRIRVGDYRILYVVDIEKDVILIADIDKRSRIYG